MDVGLPRFYVGVFFHELPKDSFFIGRKADQWSLSSLHCSNSGAEWDIAQGPSWVRHGDQGCREQGPVFHRAAIALFG